MACRKPRQRIGVLALVVEQARVDVNRQRQRRILGARQPRFRARRVGVVFRERDFRQHLVRRRLGSMVALGRDLRRQARVLARLVELPQLQQSGGGADVRGRLLRLQRDVVLVGVDREVEAVQPRREHGELAPDVGHLRFVAQDLLQQRDRLRPLPLAGEVDRGAVALEDLALVLRIGQRPRPAWSRRRSARRRSRAPAAARAPRRRRRTAAESSRRRRRDRARRAAPAAAAAVRRRCWSARADRAPGRTALRAAP